MATDSVRITRDGGAVVAYVVAEKRRALVKEGFRLHNEAVRHIPLHRQFIPWAARANVSVVHRADNYLTVEWISVGR